MGRFNSPIDAQVALWLGLVKALSRKQEILGSTPSESCLCLKVGQIPKNFILAN